MFINRQLSTNADSIFFILLFLIFIIPNIVLVEKDGDKTSHVVDTRVLNMRLQ